MKKLIALFILSFSLFSFTALNFANAATKEFKIIIKDHKFTPQNLEIPAGAKVKLIIENQDKTVEEFDSSDLNREKVIGAGKSASTYIGPLKTGIYKYSGEYHQSTAQGTITVK